MDSFLIITSLLKIVAILFRYSLNGFLCSLRRATRERVQFKIDSDRIASGRRPLSANCRHVQIAAERGFHAAQRKHILLLARAMSGGDAGDHHHRSRSFWQHTFGVPMVIADVNVGILFVFAIASLGVYGIVIAGWASNSNIRSSAAFVPVRK
jgi:hypothetical protein